MPLIPKIYFKGHWEFVPYALLFFSFKYVFGGQRLEWLGQHFPSLLSRSLVPSVPIKGFIRSKKGEFYRQLHRCGTCFSSSFCQVGPQWFLGCGLSQPPAASTQGWVDCGFAPGPPAPNPSMEEEGTGLEEKPLPGWEASNFHNIPHLQYTGFLQNDV